MKTAIAPRLLRLNREFYDTFAAHFADSRRALQPGIVRALDGLGAFESVVGVGCGGGGGLRYVHHFDEPELTRLCHRAGFRLLDVYRSDGHAPALSVAEGSGSG